MEEDNEFIPDPTDIKDLYLDKGQIPILIDVIMPIHRKAIENQAVKKTLTIPQWLNKEAMKHDVNFSQILQDALKDHLGLINIKLLNNRSYFITFTTSGNTTPVFNIFYYVRIIKLKHG